MPIATNPGTTLTTIATLATIAAVGRRLSRAHRAACVMALGIAATACGGHVDDPEQASTTATAQTVAHAGPASTGATPSSVEVEGCVNDRFYIPTTGSPVRALSTDGRLLASALSDEQGRFRMRLPAQGQVVLQVDRPQGESQPVQVDAGAPTATNCLVDDQA
jgi:hypothetical protein